jgi:ring-1,2-phenylacetyl-CoA epoxidase subunit PaaD
MPVAEAISQIPDPEVPVITIDDLGILRNVVVDDAARRVEVTITPTYSGCPAMEAIERRIVHEAAGRGYASVVTIRLSPAWTTDWMSERGRERLREFGIAPPGARPGAGPGARPGAKPGEGPGDAGGPVAVALSVRQVACPRCGSVDTEELARFGSTACKALRRCRSCAEPFEEFKAI